jgi:hypothetical protein
MDAARLSDLLERGDIVRITPEERERVLELAADFEIPGERYTGRPTLIRHEGRLAALEEVSRESFALRPLADEDEARAFLKRRRDEFDRMWDGCGCKIDYDR